MTNTCNNVDELATITSNNNQANSGPVQVAGRQLRSANLHCARGRWPRTARRHVKWFTARNGLKRRSRAICFERCQRRERPSARALNFRLSTRLDWIPKSIIDSSLLICLRKLLRPTRGQSAGQFAQFVPRQIDRKGRPDVIIISISPLARSHQLARRVAGHQRKVNCGRCRLCWRFRGRLAAETVSVSLRAQLAS